MTSVQLDELETRKSGEKAKIGWEKKIGNWVSHKKGNEREDVNEEDCARKSDAMKDKLPFYHISSSWVALPHY